MWGYAWRDVRWKLVLMAIVNTGISSLLLDDAVSSAVWMRRLNSPMPMLFAMNAIVLAGVGVTTQISQRPGQVVHSSMLFVLSLPVSRRRLVLVRELVGMLAAVCLMLVTVGAYWLLSDSLRHAITPFTAMQYLVCVTATMCVAYALSAAFATILDQLWQTYASLGVLALMLWGVPQTRIWTAAVDDTPGGIALPVTLALTTAAALIWTSVRVVERKQF